MTARSRSRLDSPDGVHEDANHGIRLHGGFTGMDGAEYWVVRADDVRALMLAAGRGSLNTRTGPWTPFAPSAPPSMDWDLSDEEEDALAARLIHESRDRIARGQDVTLPATVWERLEAGENPVAVLRNHRGLSQVALAQCVGITQGYLSQIEKGARQPTAEKLVALARALEVPVEILIDCGMLVLLDR